MIPRSDIEFYDEYHQRPVTAEDDLKIQERQATLGKLLMNTQGPLLVVGCGGFGEMSVTPRDVKAVGIDISSAAVEKSRSKSPQYAYAVADAAQLPFRDAQFKTIMCSEVIEHVRDSDRALGEFWRLLDTGDRLILTTPNWLSFYGVARAVGRFLLRKDFTSGDQPYDRWSTKRSLKAQLQRVGFQPVAWLGMWFFPPFGKGRYRLPDRLIVPLCRALMPIDRRLRPVLPSFGHGLCVLAFKGELRR